MASKVQIANQALRLIGTHTITSFDDATRNAQMVNLYYDQVVDDILTATNWTAATFRQELAQLTSTPLWEFSYEYQLPEDPYCLKVIDTNIQTTDTFKIEGRKLLTDVATVSIKFIGRVSDSNAFGPNITKCIIYKLAHRMAYDLNGSEGRVQQLEREFDTVWYDAIANDGQQGSPDVIEADRLIDVRL